MTTPPLFEGSRGKESFNALDQGERGSLNALVPFVDYLGFGIMI